MPDTAEAGKPVHKDAQGKPAWRNVSGTGWTAEIGRRLGHVFLMDVPTCHECSTSPMPPSNSPPGG